MYNCIYFLLLFQKSNNFMSSQSSHARPAHMHPVILIDEPAFLGSVPPQAGDLWLSRAEVWKMGKVYPGLSRKQFCSHLFTF